MYKFSLLFILLGILIGCKDINKEKQSKQLIIGLTISNNLLRSESYKIYRSIDERKNDYKFYDVAIRISPVSNKIKDKTDELYNYLEDLKQKVTQNAKDSKGITEQTAYDLYKKLIQYKKEVLELKTDSAQIVKDVLLKIISDTSITISIHDSIELSESLFYTSFFLNKSNTQNLLSISQLENNLVIIENSIAHILMKECNPLILDCMNKDYPITMLNSKHLKLGDTLEITAGLARLCKYYTKVRIGSKNVKLDEEGIANYKVKISQRKGKYSIPLKIELKNPDGNITTYEKELEYTVDE